MENLSLFKEEEVAKKEETKVDNQDQVSEEKPNFMPPGILPGTEKVVDLDSLSNSEAKEIIQKALNNEILKRSHKRKGLKPNMCLSVYTTTDPNDPKLEVIDLLSKNFDLSPSKLLAKVFDQYLMQQGLFDEFGNPKMDAIEKLRNIVGNKNKKIPKLDIF